MASKTAISWTATHHPDGTVTPGATWNCVIGCSHVSSGCTFCYAEELALRYGWSKHPWGAQYAAENVVLKPDKLDLPLRWRDPKRIFVNSLSDLYHDQVPDDYIMAMFGVMALAPRHTFQILTKRPERMRDLMRRFDPNRCVTEALSRPEIAHKPIMRAVEGTDERYGRRATGEIAQPWPLPNVWQGISAEDQEWADRRIPLLQQTPAAIRFVSYEPALGPIDFKPEWLTGRYGPLVPPADYLGRINWVIVGGESGPHRRPYDDDWARAVRDRCQQYGTKFYLKQGSALRPGQNRELDGKIWEEFPTPRGGTVTPLFAVPPLPPDEYARLIQGEWPAEEEG